MCLAIYKPKGVRIKKKYLRNGFDHNEDGAGFAVVRQGKVAVYKGYFTFDDFWSAYEEFGNETALIHFRWSTHGKINEDNTHPFEMCGGRFALIHNGILNIDTSSDKTKSDTRHYVDLILTPLFERMPFDHPSVKFLVESAIGDNNKLVVLRGDGAHCIYNEHKGEWHKGAWYSNSAYKYAPMRSVYGANWWKAGGVCGYRDFTEAELAEADDEYINWKEEVEADGYGYVGLTKEEMVEARLELMDEEAEAEAELKIVDRFPDWEPKPLLMNNQQLTED